MGSSPGLQGLSTRQHQWVQSKPLCSPLVWYCTLKSFPSARAGICQADEHCNWFQLTQILLFLCCIGGPLPAMLLLLFTYPGDSSSLWNTSVRHLIPGRAFSLTDLSGLSAPKIPCRGPWSCWPAQEWGTVRCVLGEETLWLSRKQTQESSCNLFIGREISRVPPNKPLPLLDSNHSKTLQGVEAFPHPL